MVHETTDTSSFQSQSAKPLGTVLRVLQINIEGISRSKSDFLSKLALENDVDVICIQETHASDQSQLRSRGNIPGYKLLGATYHQSYGTATFVQNSITSCYLMSVNSDANIFNITTKVNDVSVINIYKPPGIQWPDGVLQAISYPSIYVGDFNSRHTLWGYRDIDQCGEKLTEWAELCNMQLIFNPKDKRTFKSGRWGSETNPDLCFVSNDHQGSSLPVFRKVLMNFPHSQHRPVLLEIGMQIPIIRSSPLPRWNFSKANWENYSADLDSTIRWIPPEVNNYSRFVKAVLASAKRHIPRGVRKEFIPGWDEACEVLYEDFQRNGEKDVADELLHKLDEARQNRWKETIDTLDFRYSSRKAWSLLKKLGRIPHSPQIKPKISPNHVASRIASLSKSKPDRYHKRFIKNELFHLRKEYTTSSNISAPFTDQELLQALNELKNGKAPGFDGIHPEFLKHCGKNARNWLVQFFSNILQTSQLPSEFKRTKILAILKPGKSADSVESYRPIALMSVCFKVLERLIYNRISPLIFKIIPIEQAGFRPQRSCEDQVLALTTHIETGFEKRLKSGAVFIDLTAAYDMVWREGIVYKFFKLTKCSQMSRLINNMLSNRIIQVVMHTNHSKIKVLNNGLPQGSVLSPLLFNLYIADIPVTCSRQFAYADDLAIITQHVDANVIERTLSADLDVLSKYFKTWCLKPSLSKTETCFFHLNNRQAHITLKVSLNGSLLPHNTNPKYLGVTLDRTLSYKKHLTNLAAKLRTRNNIIHKLAGSTWGASASTLRTSAMSLVLSTAEYCSSVWVNSSHVKKVDTVLNETMRVISGTVKSTPLFWLPVLSHIEPPRIRRLNNLIREYNKILANPDLPIHADLNIRFSRLKSRTPPIQTAQELVRRKFNPKTDWQQEWNGLAPTQWQTLFSHKNLPAGFDLPRKTWVTLNRVRTNHGRCGSMMYKWGMRSSPACDCGAAKQTINHIVTECVGRAFDGSIQDFVVATTDAIRWLENLDLDL